MIQSFLPQEHRPHIEQNSDSSSVAAARRSINDLARCGTWENSSKIVTPLRRARKSRIGPTNSLRHCFGFPNSGRVARNTKSNSFTANTAGETSIGLLSIFVPRPVDDRIVLELFICRQDVAPVSAWNPPEIVNSRRGYAGAVPTDCISHDDYRSADFIGPMVAA